MAIPIVSSFDDFAEAMAVPNPNRPIQEGVAAFGRKVCDGISANPGLYAPTILQSPLVAACTPYWNSQGYDEPVGEPPFLGGQCEGQFYRAVGQLKWTIFIGNTGGTSEATEDVATELILLGPVSGTEVVYSSPGSFGNRAFEIIFNTAAGPVGAFYRLNPISTNAVSNARFVGSLELGDGTSGGCGNPPDVFRPGANPAPDPGPLPPGTGPTINVRGNPIVVLPPTIEVSPNLNVELSPGEFNFGGGAGNEPALEPLGGPEAEGTNSGAGGGDNNFGDPPDGERWAGCCVNITIAPVGRGSIPQAEPESIYPQTIGNVRLIFASSQGLNNYDTPIVNRQKTTCVWEPVRGLAPTGVRVNLLPGYSYTYRPYSVPLEQ